MMEEELESVSEKLNTTELEEEEIKIELEAFREMVERGSNCLLLKLLSIHYFNIEAFKQTLMKIWRLVKPDKFHELGSSLFLAEFEDVYDKEHVLRNGPWHFDKSLVQTKEFDGLQQIQHGYMTNTLLWI